LAAHNVVFHFVETYGFVTGVAVVVFLLAHERKETHYLLKGFYELTLVHTFDDAVLFVKRRVVQKRVGAHAFAVEELWLLCFFKLVIQDFEVGYPV